MEGAYLRGGGPGGGGGGGTWGPLFLARFRVFFCKTPVRVERSRTLCNTEDAGLPYFGFRNIFSSHPDFFQGSYL